MTALPASASYPVSSRISSLGVPYYSSQVYLASDTGLPWLVQLSGAGPTFTFTATPNCTEIAAAFDDCTALENAVSTCTGLLVWGYT